MISAAFPYKKQRRLVLGSEMAYVEVGEGDPIVLLHGNPTSSYLWRNVLPHLEPRGRCIAPDLIGMGDSDKLPNSGPGSYRFVEHRRYLDALLEPLDVHERVTFVIHDWGSALGFDWANRHREALNGIAFMEAIVAPQGRDHWDKMGMGPALEALRSEAGEAMVLQNNYFIEEILPNATLRKLSDEEMAEYRRPFAEPGEGRRPTLTWPRQIPIEGEPADVHAIATEYAEWLGTSNVPKLFLKAEPGAILANDRLVNLVRGWPAVTEKKVAGIHFVLLVRAVGSLHAEEQTAMHDALHHVLTTVAASGAHRHFGVCQDCAYLGGETCCSSTSATGSALECLLFRVAIEPEDARLLCVHFEPKSDPREGTMNEFSTAIC